jgi:TolB-like protein/DNA-binding SARP family transcriptional activator/cytochrome c-type biogenesis protein CcmH/NrfG
MGVLHLTLLGGFEAKLESGAQIEIPTRKAQAVLAYLALQPGKALSRDKMASLLWSDRGDKQAHGSLRQALTVLRKALDPIDPPPLLIDRGSVAIESAAVEVDAVAFDRLVAGSTSGDLEAATAIYQGDLLDGFVVRDPVFEEWLDCERARLHELMTRALTKLLDQKAANGAGDEAIALGQRLLSFDPLHEPAHRTLMRLYAARGQRDAALQQFEKCRELLDRELGVEPEAETEALYQAICEEQPIPTPTVTPIEAAAADIGATTPGRDWRWVVVALAVVLVAGAGMLAWMRPWAPRVEPAVEANMAFPLPDKPSIAVLPFTNLSDDPDQEHSADGMTDDLITDLSKVSGLFVIARNTTFAYKGKAVSIKQVAEDLGVRYVLEGSVRRSGDQVRVNAQLIDATTGGHLWAERFDGGVEDIFAVQDAFVREIVAALALNLSEREQQAIAQGHTRNIEAREAFQIGWEHYLRFTAEDNATAVAHLEQAVELDPTYGRAYAALGLVYVRGCQWRWSESLGMSGNAAFGLARSYLAESENHPSSLTKVAASQIHLYDQRHEAAFTEAARAIALDPNDPEAHVAMGLATITGGRPEAGLEFVETALRLNPGHPNYYVLAHGMAYFAMGDLEQAAAVLVEALGRDPGAVELAPLLAATYAHLGRREEARAALLLRRPSASQGELQNMAFIYHFPYKWGSNDSELSDRLTDGLHIAALPLETTVLVLADTLRHGDVTERRLAIQALGRFGSAAADAVPALIETLDDDTTWMRKDAVFALGKIGPPAEAAIPALTAIQDEKILGYYAKQALDQIAER